MMAKLFTMPQICKSHMKPISFLQLLDGNETEISHSAQHLIALCPSMECYSLCSGPPHLGLHMRL